MTFVLFAQRPAQIRCNVEIHRQLALLICNPGQPEAVWIWCSEKKQGMARQRLLSGSSVSRTTTNRESDAALALAPDFLVLRTRLLQRAGQQDAAMGARQKPRLLTNKPFSTLAFWLALFFVETFFPPRADKESGARHRT